MKKSIFTFLFWAMFASVLMAQTVGEVELKDIGYTQKKMKDAPKKIYIAQFRVMYQLMADWSESTDGGYVMGGGVKGKATARLAVGLQGIEESDIQEITDKLYAEYVGKLKDAGWEVMGADAAAGIEPYSDFERKSGGKLSQAQFPGYIMAVPTGYEYYVKRTDEKGREKKTFLENAPKVSTALGGAIVAKVNLVVKSIVEAESTGSKMLGKLSGGVAKLVMETDLKLDNEAILGSGVFTNEIATTQCAYYYQKNLGNQGQSILTMKNPVEIDGVIEAKKYKSVETANYDYWGTNVGAMRIFSADNSYFENLQAVPVDASLYKKGVGEAATKFLNKTLDEFLSNTK